MRYPAAENNSAFIFLVNLRKDRIFGGQKQIIRKVLPPPPGKGMEAPEKSISDKNGQKIIHRSAR